MGMSYKRQYHENPKNIQNFEARLLAVIKRIVASRDVLTLSSLFAWGRMTITIKSPAGDTLELWKPKRMDVVALFAHIYQNRKILFLDYAPYEFVFEDATRRSVRNTELTCDENDIVGIQQELDTHWGVHKRLLCPALRLPSAMGRPVSPSLNQPHHQVSSTTPALDTNLMHLNLHASPISSTGKDVPSMTGNAHEYHGFQTQLYYQPTHQNTARSLPNHLGAQTMQQRYRQAPQYYQQNHRTHQHSQPPTSLHSSQGNYTFQPRAYNSIGSYDSHSDAPIDQGAENNTQFWSDRKSIEVSTDGLTQSTRATVEDNSNMIALVMAAMERIEAEKGSQNTKEVSRPVHSDSSDDTHRDETQTQQQQQIYSYNTHNENGEHYTTYTPTTSHASTLTPGSRESSRAVTPDHVQHSDNDHPNAELHNSESDPEFSSKRQSQIASPMIDMDEQGHYSEGTVTTTLERKLSSEKKQYYMRSGPIGKRARQMVNGNNNSTRYATSNAASYNIIGESRTSNHRSAVPIPNLSTGASGDSTDGTSKTWRPW